jgi:hypothetical protein
MVSVDEVANHDDALIADLEALRASRPTEPNEAGRIQRVLSQHNIDLLERAAIDVADTWLHFAMSPKTAATMKKDLRDWYDEVTKAAAKLADLLKPPPSTSENAPRRALLLSNEAEAVRVQLSQSVTEVGRLVWCQQFGLESYYPDKIAPEILTLFRKAEKLNRDEGASRWTPTTLAAVVCYWRLDGYRLNENGGGGLTDLTRKYSEAHRRREERIAEGRSWR